MPRTSPTELRMRIENVSLETDLLATNAAGATVASTKHWRVTARSPWDNAEFLVDLPYDQRPTPDGEVNVTYWVQILSPDEWRVPDDDEIQE